MTLVYDTLTARDVHGTPQPLLAQSVERRGRTVTVRLRPDARWHDGRRLTAADVEFTFERFAQRRHPRFTPQLRDIESVVALDARTVIFRLRRASLGFAELPLADVPIIPRHLWDALPPGRRAPAGLPVGSGPYRLVEHRRGRLYRFRANRRWFGTPRVAEIQVPILRTARAALDALRRRNVDALPLTPTPSEASALGEVGVELLTGPSYTGTVLAFNTRAAPFDDPAVRRAMSQGLDLDRIVMALGPPDGDPVAVPADRGYLHPRSPWTGARLHTFRPDAARVALAERALPPLTIIASKDDVLREEGGRQVVLSLRRIGVDARLVSLPRERFERALGSPASFQAAVTTAAPLASRDPSFLTALFGRAGGSLGRTGYASARFDRTAARIGAAGLRATRRRATAATLRVLADDSPVVPLFFPRAAFPFRPEVYDGWRLSRGGDLLDKASFTGARAETPTSRERIPPAAADPIDDLGASGDGGLPVGLLIVVAAGLVVGVAIAFLRFGRRS
jgi:peptide/nickel transport system substrate-binding protein